MLMNRYCLVCILNQIVRTCEHLQIADADQDRIMLRVVKKAAELDFRTYTSPEFAEHIYDIFIEWTGNTDPYKELKHEQNQMILDRLDVFRKKITMSQDPLFQAGFLALQGNIIDYGGTRIFDTSELLRGGGSQELALNDYDRLTEKLKSAEQITYIGDNAGEAVLDGLFIAEIRRKYPDIRIYYGVRSKPAINDVVAADAREAGIGEHAEIVETGSTFAGTVLHRCSPEFLDIFHSSDLVIAKGQGNFETLEQEEENVFFIFKVKCHMVAEKSGLPLDSLVFAFRRSMSR